MWIMDRLSVRQVLIEPNNLFVCACLFQASVETHIDNIHISQIVGPNYFMDHYFLSLD